MKIGAKLSTQPPPTIDFFHLMTPKSKFGQSASWDNFISTPFVPHYALQIRSINNCWIMELRTSGMRNNSSVVLGLISLLWFITGCPPVLGAVYFRKCSSDRIAHSSPEAISLRTPIWRADEFCLHVRLQELNERTPSVSKMNKEAKVWGFVVSCMIFPRVNEQNFPGDSPPISRLSSCFIHVYPACKSTTKSNIVSPVRMF